MVEIPEEAYYFPDPAIRDRGWLRSGLLYWDRIHTIGPAGTVFHPGPDPDAHVLLDEGVWIMDGVSPDDEAVRQASEQTRALFSHDESIAALAELSGSEELVFYEKMSHSLRRWIETEWTAEPLTDEADNQGLAAGPWGPHVPEMLATVHVGFLARALAEQAGYGLVTGDQTAHKLSQFPMPDLRADLPSTASFFLLETQVESLALRPEVDVRDVLDFRDSHRHDLVKLRTRLAELTSNPSSFDSIEELQGWASRVAGESLELDLLDLREALDDELPRALASGLVTIGVPVLLAAAAGVAPMVLTAAAGVGISGHAVNYRIRKRDIENACPAIYLQRARRQLGDSNS